MKPYFLSVKYVKDKVKNKDIVKNTGSFTKSEHYYNYCVSNQINDILRSDTKNHSILEVLACAITRIRVRSIIKILQLHQNFAGFS